MTLLNRHIFKPVTARAIEALGPAAEQVADRWAGGWPKQTRALERAGKLVPAVKETTAREAEIYSRKNQNGQSHLADHELAQLYGLDPAPPAL